MVPCAFKSYPRRVIVALQLLVTTKQWESVAAISSSYGLVTYLTLTGSQGLSSLDHSITYK